MKNFLILIFLLLLSNEALAQHVKFEWAKRIGDTSLDQAQCVVLDREDHVYTTGNFRGVVDFDPSVNIFNLNSTGSLSVFISKLDRGGNFIWAKQFNSNKTASGESLVSDQSGNVYITGYFNGKIDLDPGPDTLNNSSAGYGNDIFISKLNSQGSLIWARTFGGKEIDNIGEVAIDSVGNIYLTGSFSGTVDFDPNEEVFNLNALTSNGFVLKLNQDGKFVWVKQFEGEGIGRSVCIDNIGNIYTTGSFRGQSVDFDPGKDTFTLSTFGGNDIFITKLDNEGNFVWAKQLGGSGSSEAGVKIAVDSKNDVYLAGNFQGTSDFDPDIVNKYELISRTSAYTDIFMSKITPNGSIIWIKQIGGDSTDAVSSFAIKNNGDVYITGSFEGVVNFGMDGEKYLLDAGIHSSFICKINTIGSLTYAMKISDSASINSFSIAVDNKNSIFLTGRFSSTVDFDPSSNIFNLTAKKWSDIFILKLSESSVGILEYSTQKIYNIYPNPLNSNITISYFLQNHHTTKVGIFTLYGKEIAVIYSGIQEAGEQKLIWNIPAEIPSGTYFLKLESGGQSVTEKIVITR